MQLDILFEDNHLLIVNKPSAVLTQPSGTQQPNLEDFYKSYIKFTYNKPGNVFLHAVHRLDKPVSGIVVFARTSKALSRLNSFQRENKLQKTYLALVSGHPTHKKSTLEHYLIHDDFHAQIVPKNTPQAKLCRLHYSLIKQTPQLSLLEITLDTGRYHQIRAQLSATHLPIIGDSKYKSPIPYSPNAIALHHSHLTLPHPTLDSTLDIQAPLPKLMQQLLNG